MAAARGGGEEEEDDGDEQLSSGSGSGEDGEDDSESSGDSSDESGDASDDDEDDDEDDDDDRSALVRGDIQEMRLMVGEMEKIKQRLLFRLERERQTKLEETIWQQQAEEELARQQQLQKQQQQDDTEENERGNSLSSQRSAPHSQETSPERSFVEIGVQTELSAASVNLEKRSLVDESRQPPPRSPSASPQRRSERLSNPAPISIEEPSARLSLYDLGKSYGMKESRAAPSQRQSQQQQQHSHASAHSARTPEQGAAPVPPSEASDSDTFFIRRDSNRPSWRPEEAPSHHDSFRQSQGSVLDAEFGDDDDDANLRSPASLAGTRTSKSAFQSLRNSILSSIHEGHGDNPASLSAASAASSTVFESRRSRVGSELARAAAGDDGDPAAAAKTDEQREQEAIRSLLFTRRW